MEAQTISVFDSLDLSTDSKIKSFVKLVNSTEQIINQSNISKDLILYAFEITFKKEMERLNLKFKEVQNG